jgi:hypothetical protein
MEPNLEAKKKYFPLGFSAERARDGRWLKSVGLGVIS